MSQSLNSSPSSVMTASEALAQRLLKIRRIQALALVMLAIFSLSWLYSSMAPDVESMRSYSLVTDLDFQYQIKGGRAHEGPHSLNFFIDILEAAKMSFMMMTLILCMVSVYQIMRAFMDVVRGHNPRICLYKVLFYAFITLASAFLSTFISEYEPREGGNQTITLDNDQIIRNGGLAISHLENGEKESSAIYAGLAFSELNASLGTREEHPLLLEQLRILSGDYQPDLIFSSEIAAKYKRALHSYAYFHGLTHSASNLSPFQRFSLALLELSSSFLMKILFLLFFSAAVFLGLSYASLKKKLKLLSSFPL